MAWQRRQLARATAASIAATTYQIGEPIVNKTAGDDFGRLYIGDGATAGGNGFAFLKETVTRRKTSRGDANYTVLSTDRLVSIDTAFTAARTFTLPAANTWPAGQPLIVADAARGLTALNTLTLQRAGGDTVNGGTTATYSDAGLVVTLFSDGTSKWTAVAPGSIPDRSLGPSKLTLVDPGAVLTGTTTLTSADDSKTLYMTGTWTLTLPAATVGVGFWVQLCNAGTGTITVQRAGADTVDGASSFTLPAGQSCIVQVQAATVWRTVNRLIGTNLRDVVLPSGMIVDRAYATFTTYSNPSTVVPFDDSIPTSTEGFEVLSATITPKSTTNRLRIWGTIFAGGNASDAAIAIALFTTAGGGNAVWAGNFHVNAQKISVGLLPFGPFEYVPGTVSTQTISVRAGPNASASIFLNGTSASRVFGGVGTCSLVVEEIKA